MTDRIIESISTWNFVRNNTEYSKKLELNMLDEELAEYAISKDVVNEAKELADIVFVAIGSLYKLTGSADKAKAVINSVINSNHAKGMDKDENGKVIKPKDYRCPEEDIGLILRNHPRLF